MAKVVILASYNKNGFGALHHASKTNKLNIEIVLIISNNANAKILEKVMSIK